MSRLNRHIRNFLAIIGGIIVLSILFLNSRFVQNQAADVALNYLEEAYGVDVEMGNFRWHLPADVVIDSLRMNDQRGERLLSVDRVAAKIKWIPLLRDKSINISNVRLFNPTLALVADSIGAPTNAQFLMDAFSNGDGSSTIAHLRFNSFIVRHASFSYDVLSEPETDGVFNTSHIRVPDLNLHLSVKTLSEDSLSVIMRELSFAEHSGFMVNDLQFRVKANREEALLTNFDFRMPGTSLRMDTLVCRYHLPEGNSLSNLSDQQRSALLSDLTVRGEVLPSSVTPSDVAAFVPRLSSIRSRFHLASRFSGNMRQLTLEPFALYSTHRDVDILLSGTADLHDIHNPDITGTFQTLSVTDNGWNLVNGILSAVDAGFGSHFASLGEKIAGRVGSFSLSGDCTYSSSAMADLHLRSDVGSADVKASMDEHGRFLAHIDGDTLNVGRLINNADIGTLTVTMTSSGKMNVSSMALENVLLNGSIMDMHYKGYVWHPIHIDGQCTDDLITASLSVSDPNACADVTGSVGLSSNGISSIRFDADVDSLDLHALHLIDSHEQTRFSFNANGSFSGGNMDDLSGTAYINDFCLVDTSHVWQLHRFSLSAVPETDRKTYTIISDFMNGALTGDFSFSTLLGSIYRLVDRYEPTLLSTSTFAHQPHGKNNTNELSFTFTVNDLSVADELLNIPVSLDVPATVSGYLFEKTGQLHAYANVPQLSYENNRFHDLTFQVDNSNEAITLDASGVLLSDDGSRLTASADVRCADDKSVMTLNWNATGDKPISGDASVDVSFACDGHGHLLTSVQTRPSTAVINGSTWQLHPFGASLTSEYISVDSLYVSSGQQFLTMDGSVATKKGIAAGINDSISVQMSDVDIAYLTGLALLGGISFGGEASGVASVRGLLSGKPRVHAFLDIDGLSFCDGPLGDALAMVGYGEDGILFDVRAKDEALTLSDDTTSTRVHGTVSVADKYMDLAVDANGTNIGFLNRLLDGILSDVDGRAYGRMRVFGPLNHLDLEGCLFADDASLRIVPTNVVYTFEDSIRFRPGRIAFNDITVYDRDNHSALLMGSVTDDGLTNWAYDLTIDAHSTLGLDLPNTGSDPFYTTLYADGTVHVYGSAVQPLHVDVDAQTCRNSLFALNLSGSSESGSEFIVFRDRERVEETLTAIRSQVATGRVSRRRRGTRRRRMPEREVPLGYEINVTASVTPDAALKLVMDQSTDDNVTAYGSGNIRINIKNGNVALYGMYAISYGFYHLNVQDILRKDFEIVNSSTISFDGDPLDAKLNIKAQYAVGSVSLSDLTADALSMENVRANCLLGIGGTPNAPKLNFDIELPQGTEEQRTLLHTYTATEEQMNLQFIYLLGLGKFYTYDYGQMTSGTQGGTSAMQSLLSSTISGQLNSLLSNMLESDNWSLTGNIRSDNILGTYADEELFNNMEVLGVLEGRLLDNRLLVNGNFGYRDNPMYASNFIGDFDIRYLIAPRFNLWMKGYNKTNDRYFSRTALTTQGIGLMFNKDFDSFLRSSSVLGTTPYMDDVDEPVQEDSISSARVIVTTDSVPVVSYNH